MVACGGRHTVLLDTTRRVWFCGSYDDLSPDETPPVFRLVEPGPSLPLACSVVFVACGFDHSVLLLASGCCFAWGHNDHGQLGVSASDILFSQHPRSAARLASARSHVLTFGFDAGKWPAFPRLALCRVGFTHALRCAGRQAAVRTCGSGVASEVTCRCSLRCLKERWLLRWLLALGTARARVTTGDCSSGGPAQLSRVCKLFLMLWKARA